MAENTRNGEKEREPTIRELEEQLRRKKLKEELAKKANKQTRDFDESMLGVCHTCHVPIYYGEPIHKLATLDEEASYDGIAGGGYSGTGSGGVGGIGWKGKKKSHSESEDWIQCGFCYETWKREFKTLEKWKNGWEMWGWIVGIPTGIIFAGIGWGWNKDNQETSRIGVIAIFAIGGLILGGLIGGAIWWFKKGKRPEMPDRYKKRKNPYRETLIWKLDNEGKPVKEGSAKINEYGMILDPEKDKK